MSTADRNSSSHAAPPTPVASPLGRTALDTPVRCGASRAYLLLKHTVDRVSAALALAVAWPLMLYLAWRIRRDSPGPALFRQTRAGAGGRPFTMYKFRTMRTDADPFGDSPQSGQDPRLTRLGRWLRETSLDELPQLINVLRGEMSLVGPRPLYVQQMAEWDARQRGRLLVRPGLTGLAQVHGRGSLTIEEKLEYDVRYVETCGLWTDVRILWETVFGVSRGAGIYEVRYSKDRERRGG
ncbi:MAG: sugar transferase [Phycisphaerales bacterium]|nr:sugar transferase [Phycisphaerales bacterium]